MIGVLRKQVGNKSTVHVRGPPYWRARQGILTRCWEMRIELPTDYRATFATVEAKKPNAATANPNQDPNSASMEANCQQLKRRSRLVAVTRVSSIAHHSRTDADFTETSHPPRPHLSPGKSIVYFSFVNACVWRVYFFLRTTLAKTRLKLG